MKQTTEKAFESYVEQMLLAKGWTQGTVSGRAQERVLFPQEIIDFIAATQPELWEAMQKQLGGQLNAMLIDALVKEAGIKGSLHMLRSEKLDNRYLFFLTITDGYRKPGESEMYGAGGQKRVPPEFCKDFQTPVLPLPEQTAIADFLDRETSKTDRLEEAIEADIRALEGEIVALLREVTV